VKDSAVPPRRSRLWFACWCVLNFCGPFFFPSGRRPSGLSARGEFSDPTLGLRSFPRSGQFLVKLLRFFFSPMKDFFRFFWSPVRQPDVPLAVLFFSGVVIHRGEVPGIRVHGFPKHVCLFASTYMLFRLGLTSLFTFSFHPFSVSH